MSRESETNVLAGVSDFTAVSPQQQISCVDYTTEHFGTLSDTLERESGGQREQYH